MMRRRTAVAVLAGVLLAGMVAVPGGPAGAQDIADLPRLGYEINPTQGFVGDDVHSQVNVDDVSDHCWNNDIEMLSGDELLAAFASGELSLDQLLRTFTFELGAFTAPGFWYWFGGANFAPIGGYTEAEWQAAWFELYGGPPPIDENDNPVMDHVDHSQSEPPPAGIPNDTDGQNFVNWVGAAFTTAFGPFGVTELAGTLYPQVFITTFVDPVSQEMLGEMGNFDPSTGEGTMLVPELDPGLYAVAAACAFFGSPEEFMAHWDEALVSAWDYSVACAEEGGEFCFPTSTAQSGWMDWATGGGFGALLAPLLAPRAIGIDFYCVLQDDGFCATPPGPVGLIDDDVLDEFNGDGPGDDPLAPGAEDLEGAGDLVAVQATPSFTG